MSGIRMVDAAEGVLAIEWIEGESVRVLLSGGDEGDEVMEEEYLEHEVPGEATAVLESAEDLLAPYGLSQGTYMLLSAIKI